jgi:uncharacterized protein
MKQTAAAFICGVLFAVGLGVSGMTQPAKVTAFLDFFGAWDPSLAFVMVGAIAVYAIGYRLVIKAPKPLLSDAFQIPTLRKVDVRLIAGAGIFGLGWGLAGFCPGPALTSLVSFQVEPVIFVASMILGMAIFEWTERKRVKA